MDKMPLFFALAVVILIAIVNVAHNQSGSLVLECKSGLRVVDLHSVTIEAGTVVFGKTEDMQFTYTLEPAESCRWFVER
jgi:hypothetical protein